MPDDRPRLAGLGQVDLFDPAEGDAGGLESERRNSSRTVPRSSVTCFIVTTTSPSIVRLGEVDQRHHSTSIWQWSPIIISRSASRLRCG